MLHFDSQGKRYTATMIGKGHAARLKVRCTSHPATPPLLLTGAQLGAAVTGWAFAQQMLDVEAAKRTGPVAQGDGAGQ
jgi:hypothetical protein